MKDVPHLDRLGFPLAEITPDGGVVVTKVSGSGGLVTIATCTEQLLYEVHDPAAYVTPDVVADFSRVTIDEGGADRVRVCRRQRAPAARHAEGLGRPARRVDWRGADFLRRPGAVARARLAADVVARRLAHGRRIRRHSLRPDRP